MGHQRSSSKRGGLTASVAVVALVLAGVPTAGLAVDAFAGESARIASSSNGFPFTPASVDPKLAEFMAKRATGSARMMRFTPAGMAERGSHSITVAVRVDGDNAQAIQVRSAIAAAQDHLSATGAMRIVSARYNLGLAFKGLGDHDSARKAWRTVLHVRPTVADAWGQLGAMELEDGNTEDAVEALTKAVQIDPQFVDAWLVLGNAYMEAGKPCEGKDSFTACIEVKEDKAECRNNIIVAEKAAGAHELGFFEYLRFGLVSTLVVLAVCVPALVLLARALA